MPWGGSLRRLESLYCASIAANSPPESALTSLTDSPRLRCGLSGALHSLAAAKAGVSLSTYLGRNWRSPAATVPVNGLIGLCTPDAALKRAEELVSRGITTLKLKCSKDVRTDCSRALSVSTVGTEIKLRLDPNGTWDLDALKYIADTIGHLPVEYIEEPLPVNTSDEQVAAARSVSPFPFAFDHAVNSVDEAGSFLNRVRPEVLIVKPQVVGGPDNVVAILRLAEATGTRVVITASLESMVGVTVALHCAALLPQPIPACGLCVSDGVVQDVALPHRIVLGAMQVPTGIGLGITPTGMAYPIERR